MATFRTLADLRRWLTLYILSDGKPRTIEQIRYLNEDYRLVSRETRRAIVRDLEERGLVTVDRTRRPMLVQIVPHPELAAMEDA